MRIVTNIFCLSLATSTLGLAGGCSGAGNADIDQSPNDRPTDAAAPTKNIEEGGPPQNTDAAAPTKNTDAGVPPQNTDAAAPASQCTIGNFNTLPEYNAALWVDASFFSSGSTACVAYLGKTTFSVAWDGKYNGFDVLGGVVLADIKKHIDDIDGSASGEHHHSFAATNTGRGIFRFMGEGRVLASNGTSLTTGLEQSPTDAARST